MRTCVGQRTLRFLGAHAQRGLGLCLCVCLSVTQHFASRMFIRPTNDTTYLTGSEGQNVCVFFSENAPLQQGQVTALGIGWARV